MKADPLTWLNGFRAGAALEERTPPACLDLLNAAVWRGGYDEGRAERLEVERADHAAA